MDFLLRSTFFILTSAAYFGLSCVLWNVKALSHPTHKFKYFLKTHAQPCKVWVNMCYTSNATLHWILQLQKQVSNFLLYLIIYALLNCIQCSNFHFMVN